MTLQEAKDEVARKPCYGYESWQDMKSALGERVFRWVVEDRMCEVAELYLQSNLTPASENSGGGSYVVFEHSQEQDGLVQLSVTLPTIESARQYVNAWKSKRLSIYLLVK